MNRFIHCLVTVSMLAVWPIGNGAQTRPEQLGSIPLQFRRRLAQRLDDFAAAQRAGNWPEVSHLLGEYFYGLGWERSRYAPGQKEWVLEILRRDPMANFSAHAAGYSTAILSLPFGLKYWIIQGTAHYSTSPNAIALPMSLIAYRNNGDWYLSPFYRNDCGELRLPNVPDLSERGKAETKLPAVALLSQPGIPIDIFDIVVEDVGNIQCTMLHNLTFTVRNRSKKTVTGYIFWIQDVRHVGSKDSGSSSGTPHKVLPGEASLNKDALTFTAYKPHVMWFAEISFSDGTTWRGRPPGLATRKSLSRKRV